MAQCACCGNNYDKAFAITTHEGRTMHFDSFECAMHHLAPRCEQCGCRVIGHGAEADGRFFCCAHCARKAGVKGVEDRAD